MAIVEQLPRTFTYRTSNEWLGRRNARLGTPGREPIAISQPPEFHGDVHYWNPEELFLGAVEASLMMNFISLAEKYHLPVEGYFSEATGELAEVDGQYRFTHITVKPTVIINDQAGAEKTMEMLARAAHSLIASSIRAEVKLLPDIESSVSE